MALLLLGLAATAGLWATLMPKYYVPAAWMGPRRWAVLLVLGAVAVLPPVARRVSACLDRLAAVSPRRRWQTAVGLAVLTGVYMTFTAHYQARDLFPKIHDDQSHLIQMRMLAVGRLWMPPHPLHDFFDTFYVLVKPKYASIYFPGASLLFVPTVWLNLPTWVLPVCVSAACVGLLYRVMAEAVDGVAGLLAALALLGSNVFRLFSVLLTGHIPTLMLGLTAVWAWMRWRRSAGRARLGWAFVIGAATGWAAITRPADALCYAVPIGLAILLDLFRPPRLPADDSLPANPPAVGSRGVPFKVGLRRLAVTSLLVVAGAGPFLSLQLAFNKGVTGRWLDSPYTYYLHRDQPGTAYGFYPFDPAARPESRVQQKQDFYTAFFAPQIRKHQPDQVLTWWNRFYFRMIADAALPTHAFLPLVFVGVVAATADRRRAVLACLPPLFVLVYLPNTFFQKHYSIVIVPGVQALALIGANALTAVSAARLRSGLAAVWVSACLLQLPELNPFWARHHAIGDEASPAPLLYTLNYELPAATDVRLPAVLLINYDRGDNILEELVYNTDVAWPDDAPVIYAHDLGPDRNPEIFRYYADRQPNRFFYRVNRKTWQIDELGYARDLAGKK